MIRKAQPQDMVQVLQLIQELAVFEKEPHAVEITVEDLLRDGFSNPPLFNCYVAEVENTIVGVALYYFRYSTWKGKTIHLEDLIVKHDYRGAGIGYKLYKKIIEQAKIEGVKRIEWAVLEWNTPAIAFYKKTGATIFTDWRIAQMDEATINKFLENTRDKLD